MYSRKNSPWRQDNADQGSTTKSGFQYSVPEWFLDNIKTPQELSDSKPKIWVISDTSSRNDETEATETSDQKPPSESMSDEHSSCYRVSQDAMDNILDATFSLQLRDRLGRISPSKSSITLSCCMKFGLQFLDELVFLLAQNLSSTLISLNRYDMEDIGLEFYHQEQEHRNSDLVDKGDNVDDSHVVEKNGSDDNIDDSDDNYDTSHIARKAFRCYFGACHKHHGDRKDEVRGKDALLAILNAAKNKAPRARADIVPHGASQDLPKNSEMIQSPIIIYFRDVLSLHTRTCYDWTPEAVIRKAVRERRKSGENIILIFAATHTDVDEADLDQDPQMPWKVEGCHRPLCSPRGWPGRVQTGGWIDPRLPRIPVLPLDVPTGWSQERKVTWHGSITSTKLQSFKRRLNAQLSQYSSSPPDLLEPHCDWFRLLPENVIHRFAFASLNAEIQDAFNLILARCTRKRNIDLHDIRSILLQINKNDVPTIVKDDDSCHEDGLNEEYASHEASSPAIIEVQEEYNEWERDHLPCLLGPTDNPNTAFDIGASYQDAVATLKAHLQLTRANNGSAASSLAFQTKIQSVLLYGPPGAGKTCLVQHFARTLDLNMISVDQAIVKSFRLQSIKDSIKAIFSLATKVSRCIIFIDDAEILFDESDSSHEQRAITTQFLSCLDGLKDQYDPPFILAATNDPWRLDPSFLRQAYKVPITLPGTQLRAQILRLFLTSGSLAHIDVSKLADLTEGFSGAELRGLCTEAAAAWVIQQNSGPKQEELDVEMILTDEHFVSALKKIRPSVSETDLARLDDFTQRFVSGVPDASEVDAWATFPPQTQKVIQSISSKETEEWNDPFYWEKRFLSLIINPKTIDASWSDLAIDPQSEQEIRQLINSHHTGGESSEAYGLLKRANTGGALIYGPPGTGKTELARAIAHDSRVVVISATSADIQSKYWGEGPRAIQGLFNLGKLLSPSIIFFDEADAIFPTRETLHNQHDTSNLNQMLLEMDGLSKSRKNPFVLLATNLPGRLDTAVLRRVPNKFYFGHPNLLLRERIFKGLLKEEILHTAVDPLLLASMTSRYTGSDIRSLCIRAAIFCDEFVEDGPDKGKRLLTMAVFTKALRAMSPAVSKAALMSIKRFASENHPGGIEQMQDFERDESQNKEMLLEAEGGLEDDAEAFNQAPSESSERLNGVGPIPSAPSSRCVSPQRDFTQAPPTRMSDSCKMTPPTKDRNPELPTVLYRPLPEGSKSIRVLSILRFEPLISDPGQPLISCIVDEVDLEDWTPAYRSFCDSLSVFPEEIQPVQHQIRHILWNIHNKSPERAQNPLNDSWLCEILRNIFRDGYCNQPLEFSTGFHNRYNWGDYIALSYVWGDQKSKKRILLNGSVFEVGQNLHDALVRLSSSFEVQSRGLKVWIDALCINQNDVREREVEVKKMGMIYTEALAVRGWLGHPSDEVAAELPVFREIMDWIFSLEKRQQFDFDLFNDKNQSAESLYLEFAREMIQVACHRENNMFSLWTTVNGIAGVPYWNRLWIIQELALGPSLLFWYGESYVAPYELRALRESIKETGPMDKLIPYIGMNKFIGTNHNMASLMSMVDWVRGWERMVLLKEEKQETKLAKCIAQATHAQSTDNRDKVYGLLALLPRAVSSQIHPSYDEEHTWQHTWTMFAKICFQQTGSLNLLSRLDRSSWPTHSEIPSWAFDLRNTQRQPLEVLLEEQGSFEQEGSHPRLLPEHFLPDPHVYAELGAFAADAEFEPSFTFSKDNLLLSCEGVFVDRIGKMARNSLGRQRKGGPLPATTGYRKACPDPKLSLARAMAGNSKFQWGDDATLFDVPWLSPRELRDIPKTGPDLAVGPDIRLSVDRFGVAEPTDPKEWAKDVPWERIMSQEPALRTIFANVLHPNQSFQLRGKPLREYFDSNQMVCKDWQGIKHWLDKSRLMVNPQRIFETQDGLVGCVASCARPGDRIAILFGCDMPVVLRPRAGEYEVVGGCFVDGFMNGEVAEEVRDGNLVPETIILC